MPLFPGILSSFFETPSHQITDQRSEKVEGTKPRSPQQFYDAISSLQQSSDPAEPMDVSSTAENEPLFDNEASSSSDLPHGSSLQHPPFALESPDSSDTRELETDHDARSVHNHKLEFTNGSPTHDDFNHNSQLSVQYSPGSKVDTVNFSTLVYPKSQYNGYVTPLPIYKERDAVRELRQAISQQHSSLAVGSTNGRVANSSDEDGYIEFDLTEFVVYLPQDVRHAYELRGLQNFAAKPGHSCMLFDGILSAGSQRRYVQAVPFEICSIGNYGKENHTVGGDVWIQSTFNKKADVYYRLKTPASEYGRFHRDFLWLGDLAKHFVDYCEACEEDSKPVSIHNFRNDFSQWVRNVHKDSADFQLWYDKYGDNDFRRAISFNINFLFKESIGVKDALRKQPIWSEVLEKDLIPIQEEDETKTIVTPYVYDCFHHLRFGHHLKSVEPKKAAHDRQANQGNTLHLTVDVAPSRPVVEIPALSNFNIRSGQAKLPSRTAVEIPAARDPILERRRKVRGIKAGDVLSVTKDGEGSLWRDETSLWKAADDCWYVYVQDVHESANGERAFDVIWLYKPSDTHCARMKYPYPKELFLSDNCSCKNGRIHQAEVTDVMDVDWHGQPSESSQKLFIRQTYLENDRFVTLKDAHKTCEHVRYRDEPASCKDGPKYPVGQTVLVAQTDLIPSRRKSKYGLDPFEIVKYETSSLKQYAILRRLTRRNELDKHTSCKPNELVYSDEMVKVNPKDIARTCLVRFYNERDVTGQNIPAPFNRDGTGNAFYITMRLSENDSNKKLVPISANIPVSLIQGFDPSQPPPRPKLRGLDLYCGGGSFGRGLEEGGAVHNEWAVDMDKIAVHTYFANLHSPQDSKLWFGSVNDQLYQAMQGNVSNSKPIPRPGEVDFISAGSPCQGFSKLNQMMRNTAASATQEKGLKNQSMVASVAAYVDFYRPKYGLLENVLNMAQKKKGRDQDVLSQLICAIVGMGYQLSTFTLDAWSFGSSQSRSRIFVAFTAPGYEPIPHPELSHSHPLNVKDRGIGQLANGKAFGERKWGKTPFNFVTAGKAVSDLPYIGDGKTYSCISHPDHVMPAAMMNESRLQIQAIPTFPRGMSFWKAWNDGQGVMTKEQRELFPPSTNTLGKPKESVLKGSKAWGRVDPNGLFATVVVATSISDSRMGRQLHWDQNRTLTVMEARRAQSFPDSEVILGNPAQQAKIVGNSVDRSVSLALGLSLREAWEKNPPDGKAYDSVAAGLTTPARFANPQPVFDRDRHGRFAEKSPNNSRVSTSSASVNSFPGNETNEVASVSRDALQSLESPPLVRGSHGRFAKKKSNKESQDKAKHLVPKSKPIIHSSNRVIRDSYDSSDDETSSDYRRPMRGKPTPSSRQASVLPSMEKLSVNSKPESLPTSLKRPHVIIETRILPPEKSRKVAKLSATASPSSKVAEPKTPTTSAKETHALQQLRSKPVNATHLNQKLPVVLTQHVGDKADYFVADDNNESDETDFYGFSTSEDESEDDQEDRPIPQLVPSPPQHHHIINTSTRGICKSTTKAKPCNQIYIDLTSADSTKPQKLPRPPAKLPVQSAPLTQPNPMPIAKKYVPVDNSNFMPYAQTYAAKNYDQTRRYGPKNR